MKYILLALFALLVGCDAGTGTGPVHNPWHESMSWFVRVADQRYWKNPRIAEEDTFATYPDPNAIRSAHSSYVWIEYYLLCDTSIIKHYKAVTFDFDIPDSFEWKNPTTGAKGVWRAGDSIYITLPGSPIMNGRYRGHQHVVGTINSSNLHYFTAYEIYATINKGHSNELFPNLLNVQITFN